jgi:L-malate glycosyltransferase
LKILYFSRDYTTHDRRFLSALACSGNRIYYLRLENRGKALEDRSIPSGVEQVAWNGGKRPVSWWNGPSLLKNLNKVIRQLKPDLVHAGPIQGPAFLAALIGVRSLVSMSWGYDLLMDAERNSLLRLITRYTLSKSAVLVGDCEAVRRKAVEFGMPEQQMVIFPWGVDLEHFSPADSVLTELEESKTNVFTLLSTRSWEPIYGVDMIARAFIKAARSLENQGKTDLKLLMLGSGSLSPELRKIFLQSGLHDKVHFAGQISATHLPKYYRAASLYLSASHVDGSSVSLLEAMASGCPVLVSDIPGNQEWVKPGLNGWMFKDGDVDGLCQGILTAVENRSRLAEMGKAGRRIVEERADWKQGVSKLMSAYKLAMEQR